MRLRFVLALALGALLGLATRVPNAATSPVAMPVREALQTLLDNVTSELPLIEGATLRMPDLVQRFYAARAYRPAWGDAAGPNAQAEALLKVLAAAADEGLEPEDYHFSQLATMMAAVQQNPFLPAERLAALDVLLSDAFFTYGQHLVQGRLALAPAETAYLASVPQPDLVGLLEKALAAGDVTAALASLAPTHSAYRRLRQALARYRAIAAAGGWPAVPPGPALRRGDRGARVALLRARLAASGDLLGPLLPDEALSEQPLPLDDTFFDAALEQAVRRFQQRHSLEVDGIVGPATLAALNVPVAQRLEQLRLNLDRWRRLPRQLGSQYLLVNIPAFTLDVMHDDASVLHMRVVVGQPHRRTPVFNATLRYLVFNPYWQVPRSIATREILPRLREDPAYLRSHNFTVLEGWEEARVIDPESIDWATLTPHTFRYRLRQEPGPQNALGRVKFMFPNRFHVYLHDTPAKDLFAKARRAFSHGCVRLERPRELAVHLLRDHPAWNEERVLAAIASGTRRVVPLPYPLPIYLVYHTAWVDPDGTVHFAPDLYGYDARAQEPGCARTAQACG
ncbi:MAG: peptidoglycan-binding protein [Candidatus Tectimicrobiota bacterium]|nr:MAG: peptidoglycan-binding protein [Candidatus Tectomicrobia bacterium]